MSRMKKMNGVAMKETADCGTEIVLLVSGFPFLLEDGHVSRFVSLIGTGKHERVSVTKFIPVA